MSSTRTSNRYPPSTGYQRPTRRKFYVWRDPFIRYRGSQRQQWGDAPWRWCCTMCEPPSFGFRCKPPAWERIMTVSLPHHLRVLHYHHEWARKKPGP